MMKGKTRMKKRWISLLMVLCLIVTLLPTFASAARPEGNEDGYQSVGTQTWAPNDIASWAPSAGQNAYGSAGRYLYYKDGENYRLLSVDNDPYYYSNGTTSRTISSEFGNRPSGSTTGTGNGLYEQSSSTGYYYLDGNNDPHRIYYNVYLSEYNGRLVLVEKLLFYRKKH